jgi:hypothetical protein
VRYVVLLVFAVACKGSGPEPSPLGKLDANELPRWQAECSTPLVEAHVCGRFTPDKCDGHFHSLMPDKGYVTEDQPGSSATLKRTCASEGWGIWTDDLDRIVAFCVAQAPGVGNSLRMQQFITRHRGAQLAQKIDDYTAGRKRDDSEHDWMDWYDDNMIPKPPEMGEQACIEFRLK